MNIIKIRHPYQSEQIPEDDVVLVLGFFDGVHIGHQKVIKTGMEIAKRRIEISIDDFQSASIYCL